MRTVHCASEGESEDDTNLRRTPEWVLFTTTVRRTCWTSWYSVYLEKVLFNGPEGVHKEISLSILDSVLVNPRTRSFSYFYSLGHLVLVTKTYVLIN